MKTRILQNYIFTLALADLINKKRGQKLLACGFYLIFNVDNVYYQKSLFLFY